MLFKIPAYDAKTRRFVGLVQDINEKGIQLFGVKVDINASFNLIIYASDFVKTSPLYFQARCRWARKEGPQGYFVSGFEITNIGSAAKENLRKLMEYVTLG
jgi:hypothetical protein